MHIRILAAVAALILTIPSAAQARHHKRHVHSFSRSIVAQITCDQRGCRSVNEMKRIKTTRQFSARHHVESGRVEAGHVGGLIGKARQYLGQTAAQIGVRRSLWCAAFLRKLGVTGVDDRAISFARLPHVGPQVGAIAVYRHHVGIVTGFDGRYPIIISGNSNGRRVYEGTYPRKPIAYVSPG